MDNLEDSITKELLDEYMSKKKAMQELQSEVATLSNKIKLEFELRDRKQAFMHGYKIELETKYEPNELFFEYMYKHELHHLITKSCSPSHFRTACAKLKIPDNKMAKYLQEKKTKWLHVNKI